jgi:uncharacterized RDD family membrane protein YckC
MPIGSKLCDVCGPYAAAPAAQVWVAPTDVIPAAQLASGAAAWALTPGGKPLTAEAAPKAGFWMRFIAYFIDSIIVAIPAFALGVVLMHATVSTRSGINLLLGITYFGYFWSSYGKGQTIGMQMLHMKVVKTDGSPLSVTTALIRFVGFVIASIPLCLGLIWAGFDSQKQGWHDKLASTYVVSNW